MDKKTRPLYILSTRGPLQTKGHIQIESEELGKDISCKLRSTESRSGGSGGLVTQSCPSPCNPMDCSPSGSSVHGILQARILEWVDISFSTQQQQQCSVSHLVVSNSLKPLDCSLPGPSVHGTLQARILEWIAIPFSKIRDRNRHIR